MRQRERQTERVREGERQGQGLHHNTLGAFLYHKVNLQVNKKVRSEGKIVYVCCLKTQGKWTEEERMK